MIKALARLQSLAGPDTEKFATLTKEAKRIAKLCDLQVKSFNPKKSKGTQDGVTKVAYSLTMVLKPVDVDLAEVKDALNNNGYKCRVKQGNLYGPSKDNVFTVSSYAGEVNPKIENTFEVHLN